jgi:hypothetical protein
VAELCLGRLRWTPCRKWSSSEVDAEVGQELEISRWIGELYAFGGARRC